MTDPIDDLRATADDLAADADRLKAIEREKASLEKGDPALVELAEEAEQLTEGMASKARVQAELADEAARPDGTDSDAADPIDTEAGA